MNTILTVHHSASIRYRLAEFLIEFLKIYLVIKPLQFIFKQRVLKYRKQLENCQENSIGKELIQMLDHHKLNFIPFYEEHDLKHLILDYGMTSEEEIRMQAFLFGNGNRSISCVLFLLSGVLMPSAWGKFLEDYKRGKNSPDILNLKLENCLDLSALELKLVYKVY